MYIQLSLKESVTELNKDDHHLYFAFIHIFIIYCI